MRSEIRTLMGLIFLVFLTCSSPVVEAQSAQVILVVNDIDGEPIGGVQVTVSNPDDENFEEIKITSKKGIVKFSHSDSRPTYSYDIGKAGYQSVTATAHSEFHETARIEVVLLPEKTGEVSGQELQSALSQSRAYEVFNEGAEAQKEGNLDLAEKKFLEAAELDPTLVETHVALAVVAHQRGDYATASAQAELALAIDPLHQQAMLLRYDGYRMIGDSEKTAEAAQALRKTSSFADAAARVFNEGLEKYKNGELVAAAVNFRQAVDLDPAMTVGYVMLGSIAISQGQYEEAVAMSLKASEIDPNDSNALKVRYDALRNLGDSEGSRKALESLVQIDPAWVGTDLLGHATELYEAGQMEAAAIALSKVVEVQPDDSRALFLLGMAQYNLGDVNGAKQHLARFLELSPDDPDAAIVEELLQFASQ